MRNTPQIFKVQEPRAANDGLAERGQYHLKPAADQDIDDSKKHSRQRGKDENHNGRQQHFAPRWPNNLGHLGPNLLDKLKWICGGHGVNSCPYLRIKGM